MGVTSWPLRRCCRHSRSSSRCRGPSPRGSLSADLRRQEGGYVLGANHTCSCFPASSCRMDKKPHHTGLPPGKWTCAQVVQEQGRTNGSFVKVASDPPWVLRDEEEVCERSMTWEGRDGVHSGARHLGRSSSCTTSPLGNLRRVLPPPPTHPQLRLLR